jgi:hypothetical protein
MGRLEAATCARQLHGIACSRQISVKAHVNGPIGVSSCKAQVAILPAFPWNWPTGNPRVEQLLLLRKLRKGSELGGAWKQWTSPAIITATDQLAIEVNNQMSDPTTQLHISDLSEMWAMSRFCPRTSATRTPRRFSVTGPMCGCPNLSVIQKIGERYGLGS